MGIQSADSVGPGFLACVLGPHRIRVRPRINSCQARANHQRRDDGIGHYFPAEKPGVGNAGLLSDVPPEHTSGTIQMFLPEQRLALSWPALPHNLLYELHYFPLRPVSVVAVAVRFADERTVPAVRSLDVG